MTTRSTNLKPSGIPSFSGTAASHPNKNIPIGFQLSDQLEPAKLASPMAENYASI